MPRCTFEKDGRRCLLVQHTSEVRHCMVGKHGWVFDPPVLPRQYPACKGNARSGCCMQAGPWQHTAQYGYLALTFPSYTREFGLPANLCEVQ